MYIVMLFSSHLTSGGDPHIKERRGVIIPVIKRLLAYFSDVSPCCGERAEERHTARELEPLQTGNNCHIGGGSTNA